MMKKVLSLLKEIIFVICFPFVLIGYCSFAFSVSYIIFFSVCKVLQDNVMGFLGDNFSMILSVFVSIIVAFHYASFMYKRFWNTDVKEKPKEELKDIE